MYRSRPIAWLALESLARQQAVDFPWELLVAEERELALRERGVRAYEAALRRAGCVRVHYLKLRKWIPLSAKWRLLAQEAAPTSTVFVLQAADCYSPPGRLRGTLDLMADPAVDWCHTEGGAAYHVRLRRTLRFDHTMAGYDHPTAYNLALRTDLARRLPPEGPERFVDRWLFESATSVKGAPLRVAVGREWWKGGMETKGLNAISLMDRVFEEPIPPFRPDGEDLLSLLPPDIREALAGLADQVAIPPDTERLRRMSANLRRRKRRMERAEGERDDA